MTTNLEAGALTPVSVPVEELAISLRVNGADFTVRVPVRRLLSDVLRDDLGLTGTHVGCEHGVCGACTVVLDGAAVRSCITLAVQADGCEIETVEGLSDGGALNEMQASFRHQHGLQCGFCTAGILMTLSTVTPKDYPDDESIRELLGGNLCRCTGYENIVRSIREAWGREPASGELS
jgi:carbon-monoxide dehydrogenase small subunit